MHYDFTFMHSKYELSALYSYLMEIKRHNRELVETLPPELEAVLKAAHATNDEVEISIAHQLVDETREYVLPRLFMNTAVVAVYSTLEFCISDLCKTFHMKNPSTLRFSDLRSSDLIDQCKIYFTKVAGLKQFASPADTENLHALRLVRNAVVHRSGKLEFLDPRLVQSLKTLEDSGKGISTTYHDNSLLVTEPFLDRSHQSVRDTIEKLMDELLPFMRHSV